MQHKIIETHVELCRYDELCDEHRALIAQAKEQVEKSYAPYSDFRVGAAVLLDNGVSFAGSNQENAAYPSGLCAERVTMFYANARYPDVPVKAIAVAAWRGGRFLEQPVTPCGACRQVLLETEQRFGRDVLVLLYGSSVVYVVRRVAELLPLSFVESSLKG